MVSNEDKNISKKDSGGTFENSKQKNMDEKTPEHFPEDSHAPKQAITYQQPENMETHSHHLHKTPGQGWKHYLFEFLMLFFAVFCGFLAENWREEFVEHNREKQFIESLIVDIQSDINLIDQQNEFHKGRVKMADSLIDMLSDPVSIRTHTDQLYYFGRIAHRTIVFAYNDRTIEQMKNSGGFRLIRNQEAVDKIMAYYRVIKRIQMIENREQDEQEEYKKIAINIFDARVFRKMTSDTVITRISGNPPLITRNIQLFQQLSGTVQYLTGSRIQIMAVKEELKQLGITLIEFLKKEYHLK